jgi:hypothetical protein
LIARAINLIVPYSGANKKALVVTQGQVKHLIISDERKFAT